MDLMGQNDTIVALASGSTPAGVAVIRLSGPKALITTELLTGQSLPQPRQMALRTLRAPGSGEVLDRGLVVVFPAPNSFTGEDVAELHLHGGPAVVSDTLTEILNHDGCRQATEGEFTRRAFDNGKLDLTAVEGLADLVRAQTAAQRRQALSAAGGDAHRMIFDWREALLRTRALTEAMIDFGDEDIPATALESARSEIAQIAEAMQQQARKAQASNAVREGLYVTIAGAPNAGKSTLLNALAGRDAAIVSSTAGTTRDIIEVTLDIGGFLVIIADTAGLREAESDIEAEGVRRARDAITKADIRVFVHDLTTASDNHPCETENGFEGDAPTVHFWNKVDLITGSLPETGIAGSAISGQGVTNLMKVIRDTAERFASESEAGIVRRARHKTAILSAIDALELWQDSSVPEEVLAGAVDRAIRSLNQIVGTTDVEHVLDIIFREFCIGK